MALLPEAGPSRLTVEAVIRGNRIKRVFGKARTPKEREDQDREINSLFDSSWSEISVRIVRSDPFFEKVLKAVRSDPFLEKVLKAVFRP